MAKSEILRKSFCSRVCWEEWHVRENHVLYEGGQNERMNPDYTVWRKQVLKRDGHHCRVCFTKEDLQAHHIKRFATYPEIRWEVSNGITLCKPCHKQFRFKEEEYEKHFELMASSKHFLCETLEDFYKALEKCGP